MYSEKTTLHEKNRLYRPGTLRSLLIDVTEKCNMRCRHCYFETFVNKEPVALENLRALIDEAHEMGVFHYILSGGEPTLDMDRLAEIIRYTRPDESYINITSNGWNFTRDTARTLRRLKADKVVFSMDSGIEAEHDDNRGAGAYAHVLNAVEHVLAEGLLSAISITVTHQSLYEDGFKAAYEYTRRKKIRLETQIAMPVGKWDGKKDMLISPDDARYIETLRDETPILPNGQMAVSRDVFNYNRACHCPAGVEFMSVTADGHVLPCNFCQFSLGKAGENSLAAMRDSLIASPWFQGKIEHCLVGQDKEFINAYVMPHVDAKKPLDAYAVFDLPR